MDPILKLRIDAKTLAGDTERGSIAKGLNSHAKQLLELLDAEPRETIRDEIMHLCQTIGKSYDAIGDFAVVAPTSAVHEVLGAVGEIVKLTGPEISDLVNKHRPQQSVGARAQGKGIFIGHGRSQLFNVVVRHLMDDYGIHAQTYERNAMSGQQVIPTIQKMLESCDFAVIVATAEDEAIDGFRARQNVVHEIGLFQGRLGFERVAILAQDGLQEFSNIDGLQVIPFKGEEIHQSYHMLGKQLKQFGYKPID